MAGRLRSWEGVDEEPKGNRIEFAWKNQQAVNIRELSKLTNKDNMIKKGKKWWEKCRKIFHNFCSTARISVAVRNCILCEMLYRGADRPLARPTSRYYLFDGENISFYASLVIYSTTIPPIMIINRIYENQNLLSL
jgi:hypothetical protein